jgi:hypothetical protein
MATHFPIVFEREESGVYSAYVAGSPRRTTAQGGHWVEKRGVEYAQGYGVAQPQRVLKSAVA